MKRLKGKTAVVTGGGSGIGRAICLEFAKQGAKVIVADIDVTAAEQTAAAHQNGSLEPALLDVSSEPQWEELIACVLKKHNRVDAVVNNAGIPFASSIEETSLAQWQRVVNVNLNGVLLGTKWAIRAMKGGGGGSIVNVASVSGIKPLAGAGAYSASKAAIRIFSKIAAIECADAGTAIRVNVVSPGGVRTPMWEQMDFFQDLVQQKGDASSAFDSLEGNVASQRFFSAEEVAETVLYLASDESKHLSGTEIILDRGHTG